MAECEDRFWKALIRNRAVSRWGNFTWLSIYTVLASGNDALAKLDGGRIIDTRRMLWVAARRVAGVDAYQPVRLPGTTSVTVVGDPGEMDPSQYVLLRDLAATDAQALLLMSDIVYPAGDINAWRDAVYLPYFGLPEMCWTSAEGASQPVPLPKWPVFATPGNHDWYDGLTGFMYHACGAESLPAVTYSPAGLGLVQRLTRSAWKKPARPDRAMLEPLRAQAADRWKAAPPGPMPHQPGPYYAIDVGTVRARKNARAGSHSLLSLRSRRGRRGERAALRLVTVDTGVDGSIDVEQARWVREMLKGPVPKVVVTGKPLVVGNTVRDFPINRSPKELGGDDLPRGLRGLMAEETAERVIANLAGDTHNAQRVVFVGQAEHEPEEPSGRASATVAIGAKEHAQARGLALPPVQIVAGGGGAYLSETHTTRLCHDGSLPLEGVAPPPAVPASAHHRFPSREVSARHFTITVGRNAAGVLGVVAILLVGIVLLALWRGRVAAGSEVELGGSSLPIWRVVGAGFALPLLIGSSAGALSLARRRRWAAFVGVGIIAVGLLAGTLGSWGVESWDPESWGEAKLLALGAVAAVAIPVLPLAIPVVQAFPLLRRFVPVRSLVLAALGVAGTAAARPFKPHVPGAPVLALIVAAGVAAIAIGRLAIIRLIAKNDEWILRRTHPWLRTAFAVATLWPVLLVVAPLVVLRIAGGPKGLVDLGWLMVLLELGVALLLLAGFLTTPLLRARSFCPLPVLISAVLLSVAAGATAGIFAGQVSDLAGAPSQIAAGTVVAAGVLLTCAAVTLLASTAPAAHAAVAAALRKRDGGSASTKRGKDLFRTMVIAMTPGIAEIADASRPPFHKSFLVVDVEHDEKETTAVIFRTYGLDDERGAETGHPARTDPPAEDQTDARGSFLVDSLTVTLG